MFCNKIVLPVPDGPRITALMGSLPHCKYLDCLESYFYFVWFYGWSAHDILI